MKAIFLVIISLFKVTAAISQPLAIPEFNEISDFKTLVIPESKIKKPELQKKVFLVDTAITYGARHQNFYDNRRIYTYDANNNVLYVFGEKKFTGSSKWNNGSQTFLKYTSRNLLESIRSESWQEVYGWRLGSFTTYLYNNNKNLIRIEQENYGTGQTGSTQQNTYKYDDYGNMLSKHYEKYVNSDGNEWLDGGSNNVYKYNPKNQLISDSSDYYDSWDSRVWIISEYNTYSYFDNSKTQFVANYKWSSVKNSWVENNRNSYTYDSLGNLLVHLYEIWINEQWIPKTRDSYIYDTINKENIILTEVNQNKNWIFSLRRTYRFDENENLIDFLTEKYENGQWVYNAYDSYTYDSNNNMLSKITYDWEYDQGEGKYNWRESYVYDENNNIAEGYNEIFKDSVWTRWDINFNFTSSLNVKDKFNGYKLEIKGHSAEEVVGVKEDFLMDITNFPNPFSETTTINYNLDNPAFVSIDVYNSLGNKIAHIVNEFKDAGEQEVIFDGSGFPSGVYYYTLRIGEIIESGKLVLFK